MRNETVGRLAIVLVALEQDCAVLDHQQPGDALVRQKIIERPASGFRTGSRACLAAAAGKRQRRRRLAQRIMRQYLVEMAERSNPHAFVEEPVGAGADRIPFALPNSSSSGAAKAGNASAARGSKENSPRPHWLAPLGIMGRPLTYNGRRPMCRANDRRGRSQISGRDCGSSWSTARTCIAASAWRSW